MKKLFLLVVLAVVLYVGFCGVNCSSLEIHPFLRDAVVRVDVDSAKESATSVVEIVKEDVGVIVNDLQKLHEEKKQTN